MRDRILAAADELFYREGVQTVGVDRISKRAGASKSPLRNFRQQGSLIVAYLDVRRTSIEATITHGLARLDAPRDRLLGVFEIQGDTFASPDFYGCPFLAASAEAAPGSLVERAHADYRAWVRALLTELAAEAYLPSGLDRDFWHWWPDPTENSWHCARWRRPIPSSSRSVCPPMPRRSFRGRRFRA